MYGGFVGVSDPVYDRLKQCWKVDCSLQVHERDVHRDHCIVTVVVD